MTEIPGPKTAILRNALAIVAADLIAESIGWASAGSFADQAIRKSSELVGLKQAFGSGTIALPFYCTSNPCFNANAFIFN